ncbi:hypothetical protein BH11VER1_BH11VER1_12570 [soil metagenome]
MNLILANPAGLWALLAIPAILAIHFLQERSRRIKVSTLFLLERVRPESTGGARFEKLRNSVPLWLQLLAALLMAWLLAEPRWLRQDSEQTVVVVLDSSVSMSAFKKETRSLLEKKLQAWTHSAAKTEWHLLDSDTRKPTLYAGAELKKLLDAYDQWNPQHGTHRPDQALLTARGLVKTHGIVIYVTDRKLELPTDVAVLSAAKPFGNVGFAGMEAFIEEGNDQKLSRTKWRVLVHNASEETQSREWWVDAPGLSAKASQLNLAPGQTLALNGELPPEIERATLKLTPDKFTWDDQLPLQKPQPRIVNIDIRLRDKLGETLHKMMSAMNHVVTANVTAPDLLLSEIGTPVQTHAIQFAGSGTETVALDAAWTIAESHPLTRDLNWMGLLTPRPMELTVTDQDEPLLWKGDRVMALLRHDKNAGGHSIRRLMLAWDVMQSNAARHPAFLVMLQRFVEQVREEKPSLWADNFEISQHLKVAGGTQLTLHQDATSEPYEDRVPEKAGFFEVKEGDQLRLKGATHFADTREANFHDAEPLDTVEERRWEAALKQSEADPLTPLWILLILACLIGSWAWKNQRVKVQALRFQRSPQHLKPSP